MERSLNTIHRSDCVKALNDLPEGSIDLVFADPPFNIGYEYDVYDDRKDSDSYLTWTREWMSGVKRSLKPDGAFWLAIGDEYAAELKVLATRELGFHCRSWVIWYYTFGVNCKKKFNRSHVHVFHFVMNSKDFTFNRIPIAVPSARKLVYGDSRANPDGRVPDDTWILRPQDCIDGFSPDSDTWYFPRVAGTFKQRAGFHGCQMPEQLLGRIVKVSSHQGETVLDPFSGSATTLAVAKKLDRQFIGFDISDEYVAHGLKRLESIEVGDLLEGDPEPLVSAPPTYATERTQGSRSAPRHRYGVTQLERELVIAYKKTHEGYSVDRVVADPDLNSIFLEECRRRSIEGTDAEINRSLFRIRKQGKLSQVPTSKRTAFEWEACDQYIDASEIALSKLIDCGCPTLDEVLVDPQKARQFDEIAGRFAPNYTSLEYRWAALKLRKAAKDVRSRSESVVPLRFSKLASIGELRRRTVASEPGVYLIYSGQRRVLFIGDSLDLSSRFARVFADREHVGIWQQELGPAQLRVKYASVETAGSSDAAKLKLLAHKVSLLSTKKSRPEWNQLLHV